MFLWEIHVGLKILDIPFSPFLRLKFLNNNGQIAGTVYNKYGQSSFVYIWSPDIGLLNIGSLSGLSTNIVGFNDKCHVIGESDIVSYEEDGYKEYEPHAFFWEHGFMTDLTVLLNQEIPGNWIDVRPVCLNNLGHVVVAAYSKREGVLVHKSFIWKDGKFTMLFPEKSALTSIRVEKIDDNGNMLVGVNDGRYLYIVSENKMWFIAGNASGICNSIPVSNINLPFKLKKDLKGNECFSPGTRIHDLLIPIAPFCRYNEEMSGQNSKGWVIGYAYTLSGCGSHAFLAIPKQEK